MSSSLSRRTPSRVLPTVWSGLASAIAVAGTGRVRAVHRGLVRRRERDPHGVKAVLESELSGLRTERRR